MASFVPAKAVAVAALVALRTLAASAPTRENIGRCGTAQNCRDGDSLGDDAEYSFLPPLMEPSTPLFGRETVLLQTALATTSPSVPPSTRCCRAMNARCFACAQNVTLEDFCSWLGASQVDGCQDRTLGEPGPEQVQMQPVQTTTTRQIDDPRSCSGLKCGKYDPMKPCQCNDKCKEYDNCCDDYSATCGEPVCAEGMIRRRRRGPTGMCACRRRRGSKDLPVGMRCKNDRIVKVDALSPDCGSQREALPCLCVFDIDRTLTGSQGSVSYCPRNKEVPSVWDTAYGHGKLTLSALAVEGINSTFCGSCYVGVCSAGDASNSEERAYFAERVLPTRPQLELAKRAPKALNWSWGHDVESPFVLGQPDKTKQFAVEEIRRWFNDQGVCIPRTNVHFFGDRTENMEHFAQFEGFNAREISCTSRDWRHKNMIGFCGGKPEEIVQDKGIHNCDD